MQDSYVVDIGDLAKLGLLRALSADKNQLGVAWYLYPHEEGPDGQHIEYVAQPQYWRAIDPGLLAGLQGIINRWQNYAGERAVMDPAYLGLLPGAVFAGEPLCYHPRRDDEPDRATWRRRWFERVTQQLQGCDIVFADPDNGLYDADRFDYHGRAGNWKRLPLNEAVALSRDRTAVFYHHYSLAPGGPEPEIQRWMEQLPGCNHAFRCRRYGTRTFFVLNADDATIANLGAFVERWRQAERNAGIGRELLSELIVRG